MNTTKLRLALAAATSTVVMLSGMTAVNAGELQRAPTQPILVGEVSADSDGVYLVRLADPAIATYQGGIKGLSATSAKATGQRRLDTNSSAAKKYKKHLEKQQNKVLDKASESFGRDLDTKFTYKYATNGFAVELTAKEAKAMRKMDGVVSVERERMEKLTTDAGPAWIGAPEIWYNKPSGSMGEGVVVAVLDSGINSDHDSFADVGGDGYDHTNPLGSGNYVPGSYCDVVDESFCNDKLIGAWDFDTNDGPVPEDDDGHGSHTASTVAGNVVHDAFIDAPTTSALFDISGVAPHANIIAYDVCHWTPSGGTCPGSALAAAIDQVVIDAGNLPNGIAALNYSISGGGNPYNDYVELGFLAAVDAGVYVSASAGNSGPDASTVAHLGPWVSTTAASTHDRQVVNSLIDINSDSDSTGDIRGLGLTAGYGPAPIINSADLEADFPGSTLCGLGSIGDFNPPWPPGTFNGEIVACTRGTFGRVEKGANVLAAGAGGYVLMDNGGGLVGDAHVLPGVHISQADGAALSAWLAANVGNNPMATIEGYSLDYDAANGDVMAGFSSRGPQLVFDSMKPDLTAPGVNVMGADADRFAQYQIISGTSMSSPHNAGSGALMAATRPDLTPPEIKSALMLTASTEFMVKEDGVTPADAFDHGAGRVELGAAKEAGLVMDVSTQEFLDANPDLGGDPSTLNLASMMNSACLGTCSWTRTVRNPEKSTSHWNVTTSSDSIGLSAAVTPEANSDDYNLKLKKGQSAEITVTADTALAPDGWYFASVELDRNLDKGPDLHMPVAVYATKATNANTFTKTVDAAVAAPGDTLTYELTVINDNKVGPITVTDTVPDGTTFVGASETEAVANGSTSSAWAYDAGSNSLSWTGELDVGDLTVEPSPLFGFVPLSAFGIGPVPPPSNADEGGYGITGLDIWYNGQHYTTAIWSVNGTLELGQASGSTAPWFYFIFPMPDSSPPNNLLAPFWTDLDFTPGAGSWSLGALSAGPTVWDIFEWKEVEEWGTPGSSNSFQIWLERGSSNITYVYGGMTSFFGMVGAENADGSLGEWTYFDGAGTYPDPAVDMGVIQSPGGTATLGFQVTTDACATIVNKGEMEHDGNVEGAIAATACE